GAKAFLLGRSKGKLEKAAAAVRGTANAIVMDMLDRAAVDRVMTSVGRIDHLVLAAAGDELAWRGRITELTTDQVESSLDKLRGYVNAVRAAVPCMRERGTITMLSGTSALRAPNGFSVLAAVNASVVSFGKALALELTPIRVNVVMPDIVDTPRH